MILEMLWSYVHYFYVLSQSHSQLGLILTDSLMLPVCVCFLKALKAVKSTEDILFRQTWGRTVSAGVSAPALALVAVGVPVLRWLACIRMAVGGRGTASLQSGARIGTRRLAGRNGERRMWFWRIWSRKAKVGRHPQYPSLSSRGQKSKRHWQRQLPGAGLTGSG